MEVISDKDIEAYDLASQVGFRLRVAMQRHAEIFFSTMDSGLTQPQYATLAHLFRVGSCSQNELGRNVALDSASIVGVVNRLKANGDIASVRDSDDLRRVKLSLTGQGREKVKRSIHNAIRANELTLAPLTVAERDMLIHLLHKLGRRDQDGEGGVE